MGKAREIFKKSRDTKWTFHTKMSTIKGRNSTDIAEAEDIKKRWQENTKELCTRDFNDPDNHNGVITHLELDILEWEVRRALGSITGIKASRGDGIPAGLFHILKCDVLKVKVLNMPENLENSAEATGLERVSFHPNPKEGQWQTMFKRTQDCTHFTH